MEKIFAANWKLFKTPQQTRDFFGSFLPESKNLKGKVIFFPPATSWEAAGQVLKGQSIFWGAQNIYFEAQGAFTGENSGQTLKELGGKYALIGHSERRKLFSESDEWTALKVRHVLNLGLIPMLCIGETLEEREQGKTDQINQRQLQAALKNVDASSPLIVAYEPVWAIGTGKVATPEQAATAHLQIRQYLDHMGFKQTPILYGGSVKPDNAKDLLSRPHINGFLVGGASLEVFSFLKICQS